MADTEKKQEPKEVACDHCKEVPGRSKISLGGGEVYWSLDCKCKRTPYYRSMMTVVSEWESKTYKMDPVEAKKHADEYDKKHNGELAGAY